jgi:hypothetical protein
MMGKYDEAGDSSQLCDAKVDEGYTIIKGNRRMYCV